MSTEQDKESFSLKRNRVGEGGLDVLGGPGLLLGSPDKKRRKSSTQAPPFSPLSEYAPPPIPSSVHLIAANPFDDNYNSPSLKPFPPSNPYFGHSQYPGFSSYGPPRMALHRMPTYQIRHQPFSQNPMGFNRTQRFNYANAESPHYGGSNNSMHLGARNQISPEARDMSPNLCQQLTPKQDQSEAENKSTGGTEKLNGVLHFNKSPELQSRRVSLSNNHNNKVKRRSTSSSSEPVYPCGICLSEVNDDQEAILCEASCQKWFHRVCTGMTETAYNLLTAETSAVWGCDACMEDKGAQMLKSRAVSPSLTDCG